GEAAAEERKELHGLGDRVARDVPGDRRLGEAELARQLGARCEALRAGPKRSERPRSAAELNREYPRFQFVEPCGMPVEGGKPHRRLEAKGDRQGVLQMGAPGHWGIAVAPGEPG